MFPYIDDIFHAQDSKESALLTRNASHRLHLQLGFCHQSNEVLLFPLPGEGKTSRLFNTSWLFNRNSQGDC